MDNSLAVIRAETQNTGRYNQGIGNRQAPVEGVGFFIFPMDRFQQFLPGCTLFSRNPKAPSGRRTACSYVGSASLLPPPIRSVLAEQAQMQ